MDFGTMLLGRLQAAGYTREAFAAKVHTSTAQISRVTKGKRTPSLDVVETWARALKLGGDDRERFLLLAAITHIPNADFRLRLLAIIERGDRQDAEIAQLQRQIAELHERYDAG